jgi:quinol monooxygenase YgiN
MPKLAIVGTIEVSPGRAADLLPVLMAHRVRCLESEPGTLQFEVLKPHGDDTKFLLYEVYESEAAFDRHWNGASMDIARSEAAGMVTNITGVRCDLQELPRPIGPSKGQP